MSRHEHAPCRSCGKRRCLCLVVARMRLVAKEHDALEAVADRARELVMLARVRELPRLDGVVRLELALEELDAASAARSEGPDL